MKICIIYHSETGNTRHVAQHLAAACGGKLIDITETATYNRLTRFLIWCKKARGEEKTTIEPASIDVSGYDQVIFGSPVWAFKPTPAIHAAIDAVKGCEGMRATAFCTHGGRPGQTAEVFQKWIEAKLPEMEHGMWNSELRSIDFFSPIEQNIYVDETRSPFFCSGAPHIVFDFHDHIKQLHSRERGFHFQHLIHIVRLVRLSPGCGIIEAGRAQNPDSFFRQQFCGLGQLQSGITQIGTKAQPGGVQRLRQSSTSTLLRLPCMGTEGFWMRSSTSVRSG